MLLPILLLAALPKPPATEKTPVVDEYHGTKMTDVYRWLEDGADAKVQTWSEAQNTRSRSYLDGLKSRPALKARLTELLSFEAPSYFPRVVRGGRLFAAKLQPPKPQPMVVTLAGPDEPLDEKVLLDPAVLDPKGETSIDFWVVSFDGKRIAASLSKQGSERGDAHVFDVATGKELEGDVVPAVNTGTAGGGLAWNGDGSGFFYTRHPLEGERPKEDLGFFQQVYFHKLGTPAKSDAYEIGKDFPRIAESFLSASEDGKWVSDLVQNGDGHEFELYVRAQGPKGTWKKLATYADQVKEAAWSPDGKLYVLSRKDAPRGKVLRVDPAGTLEKAVEVVPQSDASIEDFRATGGRLYVTEQVGGPMRVRQFDAAGKLLGTLPLPEVSTVGGVVRLSGDDVLVLVSGYLMPPTELRYSATADKVTPTALAVKVNADLTGYEVVRAECTSKDGTKVPLSIVRKKGLKLDGSAPVWLTGYGGFSVSISPWYDTWMPAWLELGGVFAEANLRGGNEFGADWHTHGSMLEKQNVFDDFAACAQWLITNKYTTAKRLVIQGGSNGGLLMGAALTQHPELYAAVVAQVGYYDMLRFEQATNGVFNTTEYGSVKVKEQFDALAAYSPYQHVKPKTQYPPVLFMTGANDPRVDPFHSRKMTAVLQGSDTKQPVLLRTSSKTGHGFGTPLQEQIDQKVDEVSFAVEQLKVKMPPVKVAPAK